MALPKVGVEAVIEGMASFDADSKKVNKAFTDMDDGSTKLGKGATGLSTHLTTLGASILKIGVVAGGAALVGVTALAGGLATFAAGGIKQAIDLDQQVANIAATMGATKETAGTLKDELKGLALDLSLNPNLTVDVTQAGQAIEVLAANGALATDEFGKLTEASKDLAVQTVALANATGSDFTTAATIATDAANIFGLEVDEIGKVVDGAAGIMNASKFDANDYSLALANVGPIAAGMGISLEDVNTVLAGTASSFSSGSDAGTSFKTLLQRLANPTKEVRAEMEKYGISIFDADGNMRDMTGIAADLNKVFFGTSTITSEVGGATKEQAAAAATASKNMGDLTRDIGLNNEKLVTAQQELAKLIVKHGEDSTIVQRKRQSIQGLTNTITDQNEKLTGYQSAISLVDNAQVQTITSTQQLTEAQRAQLAATLGGADGARILLGLAGMTSAEFDTLSESVNRSGQGLEAAALRVDTVKGAMDIFKGVLQAIQIQVGDQFLPLIKEMAVQFTQFATQNGPMIVDFFGRVADSIAQTIAKGQELFAAFQSGGTGGLLVALGMTPETLALIQATFDSIVQKFTTFQQVYAQFGAMSAGISLLSILGLSSENIALITTSVQAVIDSFNALADWWLVTWPVVQASALTGWEILKGIFAGFQTALGPILTQLNTQFTQIFTQLGTTIASFGLEWSDVWTALWTATKIVAAGIGAVILGVIGVVVGLATGIAEAVSAAITMFQNLATSVSGIFVGLTGIVVGFNQTLTALFAGDWPKMWEGVKITLQGFGTFFLSLFTGMIAVATGSLDIITGAISGFVTGIIGFFQGMYNQLVGSSIVPDLMNAIVKFFAALPQRILSVLGDLKTKVTEPFIELGDTITEKVGSAFTFMIDEVLPLFAEGFDFVTEGVKNFISSIREAASTLTSMVVPDWLQRHSPPPMATAFEMIAGAADVANKAVSGMLDSLASNKWGEVQREVLDLVDDLQDEGFYAAKGFGKSTGFAIKQAFIRAFTQNFQGILTGSISGSALEALTKAQAGAYAERVSGDFDKIVRQAREMGGKLLQDLKQELLESLPSAAGGLSGLAGQFAEFSQSQVDERMELIERQRKFLESDEEIFKLGHFTQNRLQVQKHINIQLREQAEHEKQITKQKEAQQKLGFLQAQVDLIKIGRELGGNVFRGITFGLGASAEDLLKATNNVVEAMISQIDTTLGIASDSKVMIRKFRDDVGGGMIAGLMQVKPMLAGVVAPMLSPMVAGPLSPAMAGAMNSNSYSTTNNFNVGGNSISNGMQAAEFEARVLQVIRRNL